MRIDREVLIAIWGSLMGGFIAAVLVVGTFSGRFLLCLIVVSVLLLALWYVSVYGLLALGRRGRSDYAERIGRIDRLSLEEAKTRAEEALTDVRVFACLEADGSPPKAVSGLGRCASEIFRRYRQIRVPGQETVLGWDQIGDSEYGEGLVRIGTDMECTEYAVRPGADGVFELDRPLQPDEGQDEPFYRTVYHLIVTLYEPWRRS